MTRWFPIAPGTTLPAAPAAVGGQITATKTVPVWNETVLLAARTKTQLVVNNFSYDLTLLTEVTPLVTKTLSAVSKVVLIKPTAIDLTVSAVVPLVSGGASISAPAAAFQLAAPMPMVSSGGSVSVPATALSMAANDAEVLGNPKVIIGIPAAQFALAAQQPAVSKGASVQVPAASISLAGVAPSLGDPWFNSVSLLLHMNGSNGSTTFTDSSGSPKTVAAAGNAQISTAQSKFGTASGVFDGNGDYLGIPSSSAFAFGTGDFTIEFWFRRTGSGQQHPYEGRAGGVTAAPLIYLNSSNQLTYYANSGNRITTTSVPALDTWVHIALCRSGTSTRLFMDGTQVGSTYTDTTNYVAPSTTLYIGTNDIAASSYLNGYLDEFRVTKAARYTGTFTPPTAAFPDV